MTVCLTIDSGIRTLRIFKQFLKVRSNRNNEDATRVKRAIISDVHGNLEALQAVLEDIDKQQVDSI